MRQLWQRVLTTCRCNIQPPLDSKCQTNPPLCQRGPRGRAFDRWLLGKKQGPRRLCQSQGPTTKEGVFSTKLAECKQCKQKRILRAPPPCRPQEAVGLVL